MSPHTASRLMRASIEVATHRANYRQRRMTRRERKATGRALILAGFALAWFAWRAL